MDFKDVAVYWLTLERNTERHKRMEIVNKELGFTNVTTLFGEITEPYTIGIAEQHIQAANLSLERRENYCLILEDDCVLTPNGPRTVDLTDGFISQHERIYLGTSHYGMIRGQSTFRGCISSKVRAYTGYTNYVKPYNMLGIHAVLYRVPGLIRLRQELGYFIKNPIGGCDEIIASNMPYSYTLALTPPMFYQADGHSDEETIRPLEPYF